MCLLLELFLSASIVVLVFELGFPCNVVLVNLVDQPLQLLFDRLLSVVVLEWFVPLVAIDCVSV